MSGLRVVHVIDHLGLGGAQTFLRPLLPLLKQQGFDPVVLTLRKPTPLSQELADQDIKVIALDLPRWSARQLPALVGLLRRLRPQIVHTHLTIGNLLGRVAAILAGVPTIVLSDQVSVSQEIFSLPAPVVLLTRLMEPLLQAHTSAYITPSALVLETSRQVRGWPAQKCHVLYNAVDCSRFAPAADRQLRRAALKLPDRPTITTFGRLVAQKRIGDVVAVAAQVTARCPEAQFLVAGHGPLSEHIQAQIAAAALDNHVRLLGFRQDTQALLAASDIYLSVSAGEVLSVAILEALASGCPVVATTAGGTAEQVIPGQNGYLARIGDVDALAQALLHLLENQAERERQSQAARSIAQQRFDAPVVAQQLAQLYLSTAQH